jgi:peptidoglycan hydrolase-like protein with peptidoglycan-binding domain
LGTRRQPDKRLTRPGDNENIPGMRGQGTPELSKNDMRMVEEALKAKGYNPGSIDGVADDAARTAIRSFQKDNGLSMTGTIDQRTAERLGVSIGAHPSTSDRPVSEPPSPRSQGRDADQNVPRDTRK